MYFNVIVVSKSCCCFVFACRMQFFIRLLCYVCFSVYHVSCVLLLLLLFSCRYISWVFSENESNNNVDGVPRQELAVYLPGTEKFLNPFATFLNANGFKQAAFPPNVFVLPAARLIRERVATKAYAILDE